MHGKHENHCFGQDVAVVRALVFQMLSLISQIGYRGGLCCVIRRVDLGILGGWKFAQGHKVSNVSLCDFQVSS